MVLVQRQAIQVKSRRTTTTHCSIEAKGNFFSPLLQISKDYL